MWIHIKPVFSSFIAEEVEDVIPQLVLMTTVCGDGGNTTVTVIVITRDSKIESGNQQLHREFVI
jgi:hypothetical protein